MGRAAFTSLPSLAGFTSDTGLARPGFSLGEPTFQLPVRISMLVTSPAVIIARRVQRHSLRFLVCGVTIKKGRLNVVEAAPAIHKFQRPAGAASR